MSGRIPLAMGRGVFDAELQGIARVLLAVPLTCSVRIYTDAKSVLDSRKAYAEEPRERARFDNIWSGRNDIWLGRNVVDILSTIFSSQTTC